jgi:arginine/ornithine N-succinyltransferase beta subunit
VTRTEKDLVKKAILDKLVELGRASGAEWTDVPTDVDTLADQLADAVLAAENRTQAIPASSSNAEPGL